MIAPSGPGSTRRQVQTQRHLDGYGIRTVQEPLGHKDVETTKIDTHELNRGGKGVRSPMDGL